MIVRPPFPTPAAGALLAANNLSDIASAESAMRNLGIYSRMNSRATRDLLHFDGASTPRAWWPLGAPGNINGQTRTIVGWVYIPTTAEIAGKSWSLWVLSASSSLGAGTTTGLFVGFNTSGSPFFIRQYGPTTADAKRWNSTNNPTTQYGGQFVHMAYRHVPGSAPEVFFNGQAFAGSDQSDVGAPSAWCSHSADYFHLGGASGSASALGPMSAPMIIPAALTDAEILTHAVTGRLPTWCEVGTGSAVSIVTGDNRNFDTSLGNWSAVGVGASVTYDAANKELDVVPSDAGKGANLIFATAGYTAPTVGRRYRATYQIANLTAGAVRLQLGGSNQVINDVSADGTYSVEFDVTATGASGMMFLQKDAVSNTFSLKLVELRCLGPIFKPVIQPIAVVADAGSNKIAGRLTSGVTPITEKRDWIIQALTNTNGNQQLLGAAPFFDHTRQIIDDWCINNGGTSKTVSLGQASAGTQFANGITAAAGRNYVALATRVPGANALWANSNGTDNLQHTVRGHIVD